jgi:hypothetical protein
MCKKCDRTDPTADGQLPPNAVEIGPTDTSNTFRTLSDKLLNLFSRSTSMRPTSA